MNEQQSQEIVEELGIILESMGLSPIASRVFGFLLVAEPPYQDFYTIQAFVKASKSSISNALNFLMNSGRVDYITFPGDRKRYFKVNPEKWLYAIRYESNRLTPFNDMLKKILLHRSKTEYIEFNDGLKEMLAFLEFFDREWPLMLAKWEKTRNSGK